MEVGGEEEIGGLSGEGEGSGSEGAEVEEDMVHNVTVPRLWRWQ